VSDGTRVDLVRLREALEAACRKRMMADVPWGVLLSGGLDSSLTAAIAKREVDKAAARGEKTWPLHSFCIGLEDSPDLAAAQKVADFLGTTHHNYTFTVPEALDAVSEAIYHMETYDVTTIRAGTPMFLIARKCVHSLRLYSFPAQTLMPVR
jgi:asparagine synthase (glutamine-hydrolysing)